MQKLHVLVADDEPHIGRIIKMKLEQGAFRVTLAYDGRKALDVLAQHDDFALVLLDLMMPVMDGWTFRQRQLDIPEFAHVPVICLTAVYDPQSASQALQAPCLHKPVEMDALLDRVEQACWSDSSEA